MTFVPGGLIISLLPFSGVYHNPLSDVETEIMGATRPTEVDTDHFECFQKKGTTLCSYEC